MRGGARGIGRGTHAALTALLLAGALAGCHGEHGGGAASAGSEAGATAPVASPATYAVGGTVSGLRAGRPVKLSLNGGPPLEVDADGPFTFPDRLQAGASYQVTVAEQPFAQGCTVSQGSGTVAADVTTVQVSCTDQVSLSWQPAPVRLFRFSWQAVPGATHYRLLEDPDGASGYAQVGGDLTGTSYEHEVFLPARVNARYVLQACDALGCVDSSPVAVGGSLAQAVGYFKAAATTAEDAFGYSLALCGDGSTLAVGVPGDDSASAGDPADDSATSAGAVYVFRRTGAGSWVQEAYLKGLNTEGSDRFGEALALSRDGNTLAVGAYREDGSATTIDGPDDNAAFDAGAAYVFVRDASGQWSQEAYVKPANAQSGDRFGVSVSLADDGSILAVGAPRESSGDPANPGDNSAIRAGAAYVFQRGGGGWSQTAYLKASNLQAGDSFGQRVALSGDGLTLAVSATGEDSAATGIDGDQASNDASGAGAVYIFVRDPGTGAWTQEAYLKASNPESRDYFGSELAISDDGRTVAVAASGEDSAATGIDGDQASNDAAEAGAVYVFTKDPQTGSWAQEAYIKPLYTTAWDNFGDAIALSGDGTLLVVGATGENGSGTGLGADPVDDGAVDAGALYLLRRTASGWEHWRYVKAPNTDPDDLFGEGVATDDTGSVVAVGAAGEKSRATGIGGDQTDNGLANVGAVYLY